jgi:hypothetical protein
MDEIQVLREVAMAASDLQMAKRNSEFAELNGGVEALEQTLFEKTEAWQSYEQQLEPFVVKHYAADERPTIKGNGFDGLEIGGDREDAEDFVKWLNKRLGVNS